MVASILDLSSSQMVVAKTPVRKHIYQPNDVTCGPSSIKMGFETLTGIDQDINQLIKELGTDETGTRNHQVLDFAEREALLHRILVESKEGGTLDDLLKFLGRDGITIINYIDPPTEEGHFAIVHALSNKQIILCDPTHGPRYEIPLSNFFWSGQDGSRGWYLNLSTF